MVFVAGSADSRNSLAGTAGAGRRQPELFLALQRWTLVTDRMLDPPTFTTYAERVRGISANVFGNELNPGPWFGVACRLGGRVRQPDATLRSQVLVLIADSVSSPPLIVNTVCSP